MGYTFSVIVSVYNEEPVIPLFWDELSNTLQQLKGYTFEVIFVNDGSSDKSAELIDHIVNANKNTKAIHFSKNFGHEAAMLAGLENAQGDFVICMDSDLQHPPSCIEQMVGKASEGYEVVTMVRNHRADGGLRKRLTSGLFYWIFNKLSHGQIEPNVSDFFMISKRVAGVVTSKYPERTRFLRGLIQSVGFKKTSIPFVAPNRAAGQSKYSLTRLFFFSLSAIATFSHIPLRLGLAIGLLFGGFSFIVAIYSVVMKFLGEPFSGYTTIVVLISLGFSLLFIVIGIIGEYIGYIFNEVKGRPTYIIDRINEQK
ncbi:glycosyltransferase family 2 protein [Perlabentimonas gracilis]|uniref:glycosyltransferase family 2 protein n=1 Tax=Perlabentimonas gracilis TaxID=2715279 RepID=UPI00140D23EA|nr:glycosyltransferase family 2 protein [Perlabentimonas gracilis]NHB68453.1 glycosyltransferase [Perlabentimonas gracilis]